MATVIRPAGYSANISRLISAAVVNQGFCRLLLDNPEKAIKSGYNGEAFRLECHEKELILSIRAKSLVDFASKVTNSQASRGRRPAGRHSGSFIH